MQHIELLLLLLLLIDAAIAHLQLHNFGFVILILAFLDLLKPES